MISEEKTKMNIQPISRLGVGPMSPEIVEAVYKFSAVKKTPLMLIASKNQIDWNSGYVNKWNTAGYMSYIAKMKKVYPRAKVYICRDHCGPGFNGIHDLKDTYRTIDADIENGFDLIHVDFCHFSGSKKEILYKSGEAIEFIKNKSSKTLIEIGTDENTGRNFKTIKELEGDLRYFTQLCKPSFYVCQTGTLIKETGQFGKLNTPYVKRAKRLFDKFGLLIKEHNADYLAKDEIGQRRGLVGAQNVAPQFGVIQTELTLQKCHTYGIDPREFLEISYKSGKWKKWLLSASKNNKMLCAIIAGHYNFSDDSYKAIVRKIEKHEDFNSSIINEMMKTIDLYISNI